MLEGIFFFPGSILPQLETPEEEWQLPVLFQKAFLTVFHIQPLTAYMEKSRVWHKGLICLQWCYYECLGTVIVLLLKYNTKHHCKCTLFITSAASPSTRACVLGTGTAPPRGPLLALALATRCGAWFGNGIELLLDGAQVGHQGVQVHCVALVQRLCREQQIRHRGRTESRQRERGRGLKISFLWSFLDLCCYRTDLDHCQWDERGLTVYVVHWKAVGEVGHVCLLSERRLLQRLLGPAIIQTLQRTHRHTHSKHTTHSDVTVNVEDLSNRVFLLDSLVTHTHASTNLHKCTM